MEMMAAGAGRTFGIALMLALLAACSSAPLLKETGSGKAEARMPNVTPEKFRSAVAYSCSSHGATITSDEFSVTCSARATGARAGLAQVMLGNRFSSHPFEKIRYTITPLPEGGIFVVADAWLEMGMGFGEVKRVPNNNTELRNQQQRMLDEIARATDGDGGSTVAATTASSNGTQQASISFSGDPEAAALSLADRLQCSRDFKYVSTVEGSDVYQGTCVRGDSIRIECAGTSCRKLGW